MHGDGWSRYVCAGTRGDRARRERTPVDLRQSMLIKRGQSGSMSVKEKWHRSIGIGPDDATFVEAAFDDATTAALSCGSSSSARLPACFPIDGGSCSPSAFFSASASFAVLLLPPGRTNSWPCVCVRVCLCTCVRVFVYGDRSNRPHMHQGAQVNHLISNTLLHAGVRTRRTDCDGRKVEAFCYCGGVSRRQGGVKGPRIPIT